MKLHNLNKTNFQIDLDYKCQESWAYIIEWTNLETIYGNHRDFFNDFEDICYGRLERNFFDILISRIDDKVNEGGNT